MRAMYGETQEVFAARIGVPFKRWNQYERGFPLPRNTAALIRSRISIGILEWIWFGDETFIPDEFRERLRAVEKAERDRELAEAKELRDRRERARKALRKVKKTDRDNNAAR